jgi:hypothetical protein
MITRRSVDSFNPVPYIVVASLFILFYGCKKCDLPGEHEQSCRIVSINEEYGDKQVFHYTSWGDPEFIDIENEGTARPDLYFKYDNQRRLVELQHRYTAENHFESLTRFYYEGDGKRVVKDSTFIFPSSDDLYFYAYTEGLYSYDSYDRIIEYSYVRYYGNMDGAGGQVEVSETFTYDYPAEDPYQGNRNYLAGNRVLMFVNAYYHKTTPAESYNDLGYPTKFSNGQTPSMVGYEVFDIQYDCSASVKNK